MDKNNEKSSITNPYYETQNENETPILENLEKSQKKTSIKYTTEIDKPPLVLAIQGGKGSGKTTLIKSLVKYYTNQNITKVTGSITIRNSKNQRITLIKCPNDINGLDDCAKIADVAITLIDARIGFEMDTFEFISLLKNHGFTSVMGVITDMDDFKQNKSLSKYKKKIKNRFLKDATDKSKLFYLYGIKNNLYIKQQLHTMARFLKVTNPNTPLFRINHPYIICDRYDITFIKNSNNDDNDDVMVSFFGYVRGAHFNKNVTIHINGLGDFNIDYIKKMDDPCPIEIVEKNGKKKRTLKQKDKNLYAPYCNVNSLEYDRNSGYINIPEKYITFTKGVKENEDLGNDEGVKMVRELQDVNEDIDKNINEGDLEIIGGVNIESDNIKGKNDIKGNSKIDGMYDKNFNLVNEPNFLNENDDQVLMNEIYNNNGNNELDLSIDDDILTGDEILDTYKDNENKDNYELDFLIKNARQNFITGAFEIIEEEEEEEKEKDQNKKIEENDSKKDIIIQSNEEITQEQKEEQIKNDLKPFLNDPSKYNIYEYGSYIRIDIKKIKQKYINHFSPNHPIIISSLSLQEQESRLGFLKIKFIKHLWYPKILKTNDPIILSIGWRRFQTTISFCVEDKNMRLRLVKYTPKFGSVNAICYGPLMPINISVIAFQNNLYDKNIENFRICGKGDLIEVNESFNLVKKIKLIGEAEEIYKKSAIIKGMFNSNLEVARYIGAKIQTVSGIRGIIKKQINLKPEGRFRASFEDKIKKSDVIFLKQWTQVQLIQFYNPIIDYDNNKSRKLLRNMFQLRKDNNIELKQNVDSEYKEIIREEQVFPDLVISKNLEKNLPFKNKSKNIKDLNDETFHLKKLGLPYKKPIKSYLTSNEKNVYSLIQRLQTLKNIKEKNLKKGEENYQNKLKKEEEKKEQLRKKRRREKMIKNIKNKKK